MLAAVFLTGLTEARAQTHAPGQAEARTASGGSTVASEVPRVPGLSSLLRGLNGGLTISGLHDGATGWATVAQPAIGYSFNNIFSMDVTVPIYMYRLSESRALRPKGNALLVNQRGEPGDVMLGLHAQFLPPRLQYQTTLSVTLPTGDAAYGLTTGRVTFDVSNLFQHTFRFVAPDLEIWAGDSTSLVNRLVNKNYTSLGPIGHFQIGATFPLLRGASFQTNAYEQLPIGDQKIYQSITRRGSTSLMVIGHNVTEDNGFTNSIDLPVDSHTTIAAYYNRSLRFRDDIVSFGVTYVLRGMKSTVEFSDDEVMRSLEKQLDLMPPPPARPATRVP